jgi:hypothetical protein
VSAVSTPAVGDVIAGYRLDELIGRGGMGVVYRATHVALERSGAVKLIAPDLAANDDFRRRFQREAKLAASIDHPHVIGVFDAGEDAGHLYVAMRYVEGTDLRALLDERGRLPAQETLAIIAQVADALDAAHARGLVHRDVKPANVLLERRGSGHHAFLTDFGLVKAAGGTSGALTRTGQWLGTPDYAAPEQIMGAEVDARADVYALGCMLFHALAGKPPFQRDIDVAKMFAHISEPPPSLAAVRPDLPPGLDGVVRTAMAKEPDARQPSAGELAFQASHALAGGTVAQPEPPATVAASEQDETVAQDPAASAGETLPARTRRSPRPGTQAAAVQGERRRPLLGGPRVLIPAVVLALLCVGAIALILGGGDDGEAGAGQEAGAADPLPAGNLTGNPSFERSVDGWDVFRSELGREQVPDAPDGEHVVRVSLIESPGEYSIDDDPETVGSSRQGQLYTASAWVKATDTTDGKWVCLSLRERLEDGGEDFPFSHGAVRASASEYRQIVVTHRAEESGKTIGVHVFRQGGGVSADEAFLVDAITVTPGPAPGDAPSPECPL